MRWVSSTTEKHHSRGPGQRMIIMEAVKDARGQASFDGPEFEISNSWGGIDNVTVQRNLESWQGHGGRITGQNSACKNPE